MSGPLMFHGGETDMDNENRTGGGAATTGALALDARPGPVAFLLYGIQWWVVSVPCLIILGVVVSRLHYNDAGTQIIYMRKLFALTGAAMAAQVLFGHRLPLVIGPASTLLVGIVASLAEGAAAIHTAILIGGALLALAGFSGLLGRLRRFFTPRIIAVVLMLIPFTLAPTIIKLTFSKPIGVEGPAFPPCFTVAATFALLIANQVLRGMAKAMTVLLGLAGGSLVYFLAAGLPSLPDSGTGQNAPLITPLEFHPGTVVAFLFCFFALAINEIGSIESIGHMLKVGDMDRRIRNGTGLTGIANMAAGGLGVIGPVDFSLSAGVIAATGCAARLTMVPAGVGLAACAFFPGLVAFLVAIPGPVMGALLLYLMATQLAGGLAMLGGGATDFTGGVTVGIPVMLALTIAFAPAGALDAFPQLLRPVIGNGFVMGTLAVVFLEHGVFRPKQQPPT